MTADLSSILPATDQSVGDTQEDAVGGGNPSLAVVPGPAQGGCDPHHAAVGVGDDTLARRAEQTARVRILSEMLDDVEQTRIAAQNRYRSLTDPQGKGSGKGRPRWNTEVAAVGDLTDDLARMERQVRAELRRAVRAHFLGGWVKRQIGVGEEQAGRLLGVIGDPASRERPSQLWAYCGYHVVDGAAPVRRKKQRANWSTVAKSRAYLIAEACLKQRGGVDKNGKSLPRSPYRDVYDAARVKHAAATHDRLCVRCGPSGSPAQPGSDLADGHKHARAMRATSKAVLLDLWREAHRTLTED